jgi:uncharacterized membrane protein
MSTVEREPESTAEITAPPVVDTPSAVETAVAETPVTPSPTRRALGVDVARAVALIGMVCVHVLPDLNADGTMTWPFAVFGGRAAALFAVLAGVSIAFVEKRSRGHLYGRTLAADRAALVVRGLIILVIGLLLGHLDSPIETIIPYLGILFILALPFYGRSSRFLLIAAPIFAIIGPVLRHLLNGHIPEQVDPEADYTLITAAQQPVAFIFDMLVTGLYPALPWMTYLCVGMVIGRQVLTSRKVALMFVGWGAALAIAAWVLSKVLLGPAGGMQRLIEATPSLTPAAIVEQLTYGPDAVMMPNTTWWWLAAVSPYSHTPLNVLHDLGSAVAALGVILLLTHSGAKVFSPFAAIGAMTLTLYSAHCILLTIDVLDEERPMISVWVQVISFMLFAVLWRSAIGKGPLETIISEASDGVRRRVRTPRESPRVAGVGSKVRQIPSRPREG